jgi:hypothetical protein
MRMISRLLIIGATVVALSACASASKPYNPQAGANGGAGFGNSVAPPDAAAAGGCASDQPANVQQNAPAGATTLRCHNK